MSGRYSPDWRGVKLRWEIKAIYTPSSSLSTFFLYMRFDPLEQSSEANMPLCTLQMLYRPNQESYPRVRLLTPMPAACEWLRRSVGRLSRAWGLGIKGSPISFCWD